MKDIRVLVLAVICFGGCKKSEKDAVDGSIVADSAAGQSIACYVADMWRCDEYPMPSAENLSNVPVACSSNSGVLSMPANCPAAGFAGKCVHGSGVGQHVERFYTGADVTYAADFCVNTALGTWSTTF